MQRQCVGAQQVERTPLVANLGLPVSLDIKRQLTQQRIFRIRTESVRNLSIGTDHYGRIAIAGKIFRKRVEEFLEVTLAIVFHTFGQFIATADCS